MHSTSAFFSNPRPRSELRSGCSSIKEGFTTLSTRSSLTPFLRIWLLTISVPLKIADASILATLLVSSALCGLAMCVLFIEVRPHN